MKKLVLFLATSLLILGSCHKADIVPYSSTLYLSQTESDDLQFLIQEEKLARDVYIFAYQKHGDNIFNNISKCEQSYMDQVANLMVKYNVSNPIIGFGIGEFENATLQQLYYDLTAIVENSSNDGLTVGTTIEDLDIDDIDELYANTINTDLLSLYDQLTCGSRNHMRSFYSKLISNGLDYTPQYISQEEFYGIINTEKENCK